MPAFIDLSGGRFGKWVVQHRAAVRGKTSWVCKCDCGAERAVLARNLSNGTSRSCGCARFDKVPDKTLRNRYRSIKRRCTDPRDPAYPNYGGRGIQFLLPPYAEFVEAMLPTYTPGATIDRIDNDGPYSLDNIRWASIKEQSNNTRVNRKVTANGKTQTLAQWVEELGVPRATLYWRLHEGWTDDEIINTPVIRKPRRRA